MGRHAGASRPCSIEVYASPCSAPATLPCLLFFIAGAILSPEGNGSRWRRRKGKQAGPAGLALTKACSRLEGATETEGGSFTISSDKPNFKSVQVKDADGKMIDTFTQGMPWYFNKKWGLSWTLRKQVAKPKISITWFSKEETVKVPVDVSIGLGL
jgi:hypothetical protein